MSRSPSSGAGTNSKVGAHVRCKASEFFVMPLHFFGSKSTISRLGERFHDGQYSLVSFLFVVIILTVPRAQPFVKVPPGALCSRRHCCLPLCLPLCLCVYVLSLS